VSHHHIKLDLSAQVSLNELIHIYDIHLPDVTVLLALQNYKIQHLFLVANIMII